MHVCRHQQFVSDNKLFTNTKLQLMK